MGTTLVAAALCQGRLAVAHVGDSRLYRLRGGRLERLTRDHSFEEELRARGYSTTEALRRAESKALTRALGPSLEVEIDLASFDVHSGDVLLLCSDGLTGLIGDEEIAAELEAGRLASRSLDLQAEALIALANQRGGHDNITVVLALC
jgi:protein phosphatase